MKTKISLLIALVATLSFFMGCEEEENADLGQNGQVVLSLTDAPIDDTSITGVYITITGIKYHKKNNEWKTFEEFEGPQTHNLLELQDSISVLLGDFEMEAGQYNQLRFMLDAAEKGQDQGQGNGRGQGGPSTTPGCYLEYEDGSTQDLFVPSGGQSGYKATGSFRVPSNGTVKLTADFDVRKSVVKAGNSGRYILKPTIRLVTNNEAGAIVGSVTNMPEDSSDVTIYAYENDTYSDKEATAPADEENRFSNAVTSDMVCDTNRYRLSWLAPMTYDLIVVNSKNGEFIQVLGIVENVEVISRKTTQQPIDISDLSSQ
jgi:hypothetical protein